MPSDSSEAERGSTSTAKRRWPARSLASAALVLASIVAGLGLLEIGCRLARGPEALTDWRNLVVASRIEARRVQGAERGSAYAHDPVLGFVNSPDYASPEINFDSQGFRRTPPLAAGAVQGPPILATGDSYTKGDDVSDGESWPARLQDGLAWRTVNAGVGAYGLDQTVLLTERLVARLKPAAVVLGFIADDLRRAEMSRMWGREKPYFELMGGELVLRNVPVPEPGPVRDTLGPLQWAFGWSVLVDTVLDRLRLRNEWHMDHARALPAGTGERLACPLMRRVAALGVPTLVVAQYLPNFDDEEHREARVVLACAAAAGLATLDLYDRFAADMKAGGRDSVYGAGTWHPNARGYRLIAEAVAGEITRRGMLPR